MVAADPIVTGEAVTPKSLSYNLRRLCEEGKGAILTKVGESKNIRYRFRNPLMKVFVKLKLQQKASKDQKLLF